MIYIVYNKSSLSLIPVRACFQQNFSWLRIILVNKQNYMRKLFSPFIFSTIIMSIGLCGELSAQMYEDTWHSVKTYKSRPGISVDINNKYGSVIVSTWDRDSVKIEVSRKIYERSGDRLNTLRDNINIDHKTTLNKITVETIFGSKHSSIVRDIREMANFSVSESRSRIDYNIYLPANANIKIVNKYGNIVLPTLNGTVEIDLSNGDFQARELNGDANITLAFGNAFVGTINNGTIALNFVDFTGSKMNSVSIEGRSSDIKINSANTINLNSRRDKVQITSANNIVADTYFSNLNFLKVEKTASLKLTYGELTNITLSNRIENCDIISQTCNVNLTLINPLPYKAMIKQNRGTINLPASLINEASSAQKRNNNEPTSYYFKRNDATNKININISDSELKINHH
jgi:hypothetical protein